MRTLNLLLVGVLFVGLAGCTQVWVMPPGGTEAQFQRDAYVCERDAAGLPYAPRTVYPQIPGGYGAPGQGLADLAGALGNRAQRDRLFNQCMEAAGYRQEK
mgnify:CR=1 FL=1